MTRFRAIAAISVAGFLLAACSSNNDERCGDGQDNDSNGLIDCQDPACGVGASCGPSGYACAPTGCACSGNGGTAQTVESLCDDGVDNDCDGNVDCGGSCAPCSGITPGGGGTKQIGYIRLAAAEWDVLGAIGSGYHEQSLLTFEVLASDGTPYAGLPVKFNHLSQGDSFIGSVATPAGCTTADPPVCEARGTTDANGQVAVLLHSGRWFGVLSVKIEATAAGVSRSFTAGGFTVIGAKPNGARFSVDCRPYNVPAYTTDDCLYSRYTGAKKFPLCTATVGDRHDNPVAVPTLISFQSEAGLIVPATFTPAYDPKAENRGLGQGVGVLEVYGAPLPFDVAPLEPQEPRALNLVDYGCGPRTTNPRDGLVTVIAIAQGEEGFVDSNLNGWYDVGEPFIDLGEPFLDVDDDGIRDATEWYQDVDGDLAYTGPNGKWDPDTVLWTQGRVLYTGYPFFARATNGYEQFTRVYTTGTPPTPTPPAPPFAPRLGPPPIPEWYGVFFADHHLNPLTSGTTFAATPLAGNVSANMTEPDNTADSLGMSFRMLYCNHPTAPTVCRDGPADQGCLAAATGTPPRCYLRTEVGGQFFPGNDATLAISCVRLGPDVVSISATIEGVTSAFAIGGECVP